MMLLACNDMCGNSNRMMAGVMLRINMGTTDKTQSYQASASTGMRKTAGFIVTMKLVQLSKSKIKNTVP